MDFLRILSNSEMCRTCLERKSEFTCLTSIDTQEPDAEITIRHKLSECVPYMNLTITPNAVVCNKCLSAINCVLNFKKQCSQTEERIQSYAGQTGTSDVKVIHIIQENIQIKQEPEDMDIKDESLNCVLYVDANNLDEIKQEEEYSEAKNEVTEVEFKSHTQSLPLDTHKTVCDEENGSFICNKCGDHTTCEAELILHLRQHEEPKEPVLHGATPSAAYKRFECKECGYKCSRKSVLNDHMMIHTGDKPYHCTECDYQSNKRNNLVKHTRKHTGETIKCHLCDYGALSKSGLRVHMRTHTGEKPFKCTQCPYESATSSNLKLHVKTHAGEYPYKCDLCDYKTARGSALIVHVRTHTGEKPFKCPECPYSFATNGNLKLHTRVHTKELPYECSRCNYKSARGSDLVVHMRSHTGEKPYKCTECSYRSTNKGDVQVHGRTHTGEKKFACNLCDDRFSRRCNLARHLRKHTDERPYQCARCPYTSKDQSSINRHMKLHEKDATYKCKLCSFGTTTNSGLTRHMQLHINFKPREEDGVGEGNIVIKTEGDIDM